MTDTDIEAINEQAPPQFELDQTDAYSQFLLYAKSEILAVFRSLILKNAMITAHFDQGYSFLLTSMVALSADNKGFILDVGSDDEMNRRALQAKKLIFTALIDKVKIQFSVEKISLINYEGRSSFLAMIPDKLLRLQRREYFRLSTPIANPLKLRTTLTRPDGSALQMELPLLDISGGGVGLMIPLELGGHVEIGQVREKCRIALPCEGIVTSALGVRNLFAVTTRSGTNYVRLGGEFVKLDASALRSIQRYIINVERERKALLNGLA